MLLSKAFALVGLCAQACHAQQPVEVYQRWLMIIKPEAQAGGPFVGSLTQEDIDRTTEAFQHTWPRMIREITDGRVMIEGQVVVSSRPLTQVNPQYTGMVGPEHMPEDVEEFVSPDQWDGVAVYSAFEEHAYWGTPEAASVGWFSVNHRTDLSYQSDALAGWIHEMLHTSAWYFADSRLGPQAPSCGESQDGRDGVHCAASYGYVQDTGGLPSWIGWYRDYLNGAIEGGLGLGSKAWTLGSRRESYLGLSPGDLIPQDQKSERSEVSRMLGVAGTKSNDGMSTEIWA